MNRKAMGAMVLAFGALTASPVGRLDALLATAEFCEQALGRELHGRVTRSGLSPLI